MLPMRSRWGLAAWCASCAHGNGLLLLWRKRLLRVARRGGTRGMCVHAHVIHVTLPLFGRRGLRVERTTQTIVLGTQQYRSGTQTDGSNRQ
jgi:hypothetical protein